MITFAAAGECIGDFSGRNAHRLWLRDLDGGGIDDALGIFDEAAVWKNEIVGENCNYF